MMTIVKFYPLQFWIKFAFLPTNSFCGREEAIIFLKFLFNEILQIEAGFLR